MTFIYLLISGFEKINICPLLNTLRFIVINESESKITLQDSILNNYDSATTSSLKKIFDNFVQAESKRTKKIKNIKYERFDKKKYKSISYIWWIS